MRPFNFQPLLKAGAAAYQQTINEASVAKNALNYLGSYMGREDDKAPKLAKLKELAEKNFSKEEKLHHTPVAAIRALKALGFMDKGCNFKAIVMIYNRCVDFNEKCFPNISHAEIRKEQFETSMHLAQLGPQYFSSDLAKELNNFYATLEEVATLQLQHSIEEMHKQSLAPEIIPPFAEIASSMNEDGAAIEIVEEVKACAPASDETAKLLQQIENLKNLNDKLVIALRQSKEETNNLRQMNPLKAIDWNQTLFIDLGKANVRQRTAGQQLVNLTSIASSNNPSK